MFSDSMCYEAQAQALVEEAHNNMIQEHTPLELQPKAPMTMDECSLEGDSRSQAPIFDYFDKSLSLNSSLFGRDGLNAPSNQSFLEAKVQSQVVLLQKRSSQLMEILKDQGLPTP